jgi:hypothetical protein
MIIDNLHDELAETGASLLTKDLRQPLRVPEGYFERLEDAVLQRLEAEGLRQQPPKRHRPVSRRLILRLVAAAAAVLALVWFARNAWSPAEAPLPLPELTADEIKAYLQENPELLEPEALGAVLPEDFEKDATPDSLVHEVSWELFLRDLSPEEVEQLNL